MTHAKPADAAMSPDAWGVASPGGVNGQRANVPALQRAIPRVRLT